MLVVPHHKALVLKARNPEQIINCVPESKKFHFQGTDLVYVPHHLDAVRILRNIGAKAPGPINHYYEFPLAEGRHPPFSHQRITADFLTLNQRCAVLNEQRTGKTLSCLWAADYLMKEKMIRKVLIVSPLSTLEPVWGDAIYLTFYHRKGVVLHGSAEYRKKMLKTDADFYIINHDGFNIIADHIPDDVDLVIYDEAAVLRTPSTSRFKRFNKFIQSRPDIRLWLLTGTPTPNEPTDAWALCHLLGQQMPRYSLFKDMVMRKVGQWTWRPRHDSELIVQQFLQPSIRYTRDECFDLPETIYETRKCELHPEQERLFKKMMKDLVAEVGSSQITAINEAVKIQKLLQILLGVVYGKDGERVFVDCSPRVQVILEIIEESGGKAIVFVPFTGALDEIAERIGKHHTVAVVNGGVSKSKRDVIFKEFCTCPDPRVLVADARTMSHGLDLSAAPVIIWAGPTNSNDTYGQANARIVGPKQHLKTSVVHIEATNIEKQVFQRLKARQSLQGLLLDAIQQQEVI